MTVTGPAVRSYRTLSPFPGAVAANRTGRFAFCGAVPGVAPAGRYPAPYFRGARTFLPRWIAPPTAVIQPSDSDDGLAGCQQRVEACATLGIETAVQRALSKMTLEGDDCLFGLGIEAAMSRAGPAITRQILLQAQHCRP